MVHVQSPLSPSARSNRWSDVVEISTRKRDSIYSMVRYIVPFHVIRTKAWNAREALRVRQDNSNATNANDDCEHVCRCPRAGGALGHGTH